MTAPAAVETRPASFREVLRPAVLWLAFLAPFFYLTYGGANWLAAQRDQVGSIVFDWERSVPFVAWTIVPYWSINLFYGLALVASPSAEAVYRLAGRYLTAQVIAVTCFVLFPLTATFARPQTEGLPGFLFAVLGGFDKPFNQAPSLHIALLVIIWDHLRHRLPAWTLPAWHVWCLLIGASVLTTWQHHFIDVPTGALLGLFALWLFPRTGPLPLSGARLVSAPKARRLAGYYLAAGLAFLAAAVAGAFSSALWLILIWPAVALAIVAFGYATANPGVFQKQADGRASLASRLLLWPYRLGARVNRWAWTRNLPHHVQIMDGVWLGRFPSAAEASGFAIIIDLSAEFERPRGSAFQWRSFPMLDLVSPSSHMVAAAAAAVEQSRAHGPVLVCCALGFQRSAAVVCAWLLTTSRAASIAEAQAILQLQGRRVHLPELALP